MQVEPKAVVMFLDESWRCFLRPILEYQLQPKQHGLRGNLGGFTETIH